MFFLTRAATSADPDRGPPLRAYIIFMTVLIVIAICLRFWSRCLGLPSRNQPRFMWDDWAALASACVLFGQFGVSFELLHLGFGHHIWMLPSENLAPFLKLLFATYFIVYTGVCLGKTSALFFLSRIFPPFASPTWFTVGVAVTHLLNVAWLVGMVFGTAFNCNPVAKNWDPSLPGKCGPTSGIWIASVVPSVFIDLLILILPIPRIWAIKASRSRKAGLSVVFVLGYLAIVVSVGRMITVLKSVDAINNDFTYEGMADVYWVSTEGPVILLGACLPTMIPLGRHIKTKYLSPMASSISQARLRYGTSSGRSRSHTGDVPTSGTSSVYRTSDLAQAQHSATKLNPSGRDLESFHDTPNPADTFSKSPRLTQPQTHYAAGVESDEATRARGAPLAVPERYIRVDSNFTISHQPY